MIVNVTTTVIHNIRSQHVIRVAEYETHSRLHFEDVLRCKTLVLKQTISTLLLPGQYPAEATHLTEYNASGGSLALTAQRSPPDSTCGGPATSTGPPRSCRPQGSRPKTDVAKVEAWHQWNLQSRRCMRVDPSELYVWPRNGSVSQQLPPPASFLCTWLLWTVAWSFLCRAPKTNELGFRRLSGGPRTKVGRNQWTREMHQALVRRHSYRVLAGWSLRPGPGLSHHCSGKADQWNTPYSTR